MEDKDHKPKKEIIGEKFLLFKKSAAIHLKIKQMATPIFFG